MMRKSLRKLPLFISLAIGLAFFASSFLLADKTAPYQATTTPALVKVSSAPPLTINILASADAFTPKLIRVQVGQEVNVRILARGTHSFTIDALKVDTITPDNQTTIVTLRPELVGTFRFYSRIGNDIVRGMAGQLIVGE